MKCPQCLDGSTKVVDTRLTGENEVRRRRECHSCEERFTTYERLESPSLSLEKNDGSVEVFQRAKLKEGVEQACNKRPVEQEAIESLVDSVESRIRREAGSDETVTSERVGELVMQELRDLDKVAYVRFASVYRSFDDIDSFEKELEELKTNENN